MPIPKNIPGGGQPGPRPNNNNSLPRQNNNRGNNNRGNRVNTPNPMLDPEKPQGRNVHISEQYDFDERSRNLKDSRKNSVPATKRKKQPYTPIVNQYDEEDAFESLTPNEQLSLEDEEDNSLQEDYNQKAYNNQYYNNENNYEQSDDNDIDLESDYLDDDFDENIDEYSDEDLEGSFEENEEYDEFDDVNDEFDDDDLSNDDYEYLNNDEENFYGDEDDLYAEDDEQEKTNSKQRKKRLKEEKKNNKSRSKKKEKSSSKIKRNKDFIDEDNNELKPFGSEKNVKDSKKLNVSSVDNRADIRKKAVVVQWCVIILLIILALMAIKNSLIPPKTLSQDEVATISKQANGKTNFPVEGGKGFVTNFMQAYLTAPPDSIGSKVLSYYYNGGNLKDSNLGSTNLTVNGEYKQDILYGPTIYDSTDIDDNFAKYVVAALVRPDSKITPLNPDVIEPKWQFFNVNVYYDEIKDTYSIIKDSPSVVPAKQVGDSKDIPERLVPGSGKADDELLQTVKPTINGFLDAYAISSRTNHGALDAYITDKNDSSLTNGLNGQYEFVGGEADNAIDSLKVYPETEEKGGNQVAYATINMRWANVLPSGNEENTGGVSTNRIEYSSEYLMTLYKQADGSYKVSRFVPNYYIPDPESLSEIKTAETNSTNENE